MSSVIACFYTTDTDRLIIYVWKDVKKLKAALFNSAVVHPACCQDIINMKISHIILFLHVYALT